MLGGLLPLVLLQGCQQGGATAKTPAAPGRAVTATAPKSGAADGGAQVQAQAVEPVEVQVSVLTPKIDLEKTVHDWGDIGPETRQTTQFKFTNAGQAPLKIIQVKACCGCRTKGVKNGQQYAPGESGTLELECDIVPYPGTMKRSISLLTNDPEQKVVALVIKGNIVRRVDYKPERLKLFLRQENGGCSDITLTSLDDKPFSITGFRSTANALSAEFDPAVQATEFVLKPKADMEKLQRNLKGQVSIELTHPECKTIRMLYDVLPEFTINPPQMMMFNVKANQPLQREVWILSNYQDEFEIESVASQKGTVKLVEQKRVGNRYQLTLEITPPDPEGERSVLSDMVEVKIKDGATLSIPFRGFY